MTRIQIGTLALAVTILTLLAYAAHTEIVRDLEYQRWAEAHAIPTYCAEDNVLIGKGDFNGERYEWYDCGPALDDFDQRQPNPNGVNYFDAYIDTKVDYEELLLTCDPSR